jgi:glycosyltransferase involved in cell wall biosynthesis
MDKNIVKGVRNDLKILDMSDGVICVSKHTLDTYRKLEGINYLITGFKKVLENYPDTRLFIAGDGNFNGLLKESSGFWSKINFTGRLDKETLYDFYQMADMGVVCSLHEEFGLVAIEMMMHALPVIVTKTSGLDEIVEDTLSGCQNNQRQAAGGREMSG